MRVGTVIFGQIAGLLIVLSLGFPLPSEAGVFWTDDFENHLYPNWIGGSNCLTAGSPDGNGCGYPRISTAIAHSGTQSLLSHYSSLDVQAGTYIDRDHAGVDSVYMRWYQYTVAFTYSPIETKNMFNLGPSWFYWRHDNGDVNLGGGGMALTQSYTCPNGRIVLAGDTCNFPPNMTPVPLNNGQWYCIETHASLGTVNGADSVLEIWVNGIQTTGYYNIPTRQTSAQFTTARHYAQYGLGDRYIDDLVVGDTRIGCSGSVPTADTTPPAPPVGLVIK